ncbi:DUF1311 domain-containing protein [Alteromonas pelagimontana]|uniref:DUF1311 domain-containing protein n=1 Tax=Alteromonas pelagimontana TaxID=1858656 RepID=A0A6M4M9A7_9ALTE|nr:lysozyme inhibitor LprI family protein [Alteromonas pelagimontana]QJR79744.1 DUF1311 domain-containing protein [Alteromonas pelagimontana]
MKKYIAIFIATFSTFVLADEVDCENAMTTYAMNICARREIKSADAELEKYLAKAKEKYSDEAAIIQSLDKSQNAWLLYREAHCDAIYEMWSGGTIRGVMFGGCMLQLTKQRTHKIWEDFLAEMGSASPLLPEPT